MKRKRGRRTGRHEHAGRGRARAGRDRLFTYLGFTKFANPFASQYTVHAIFPSANGLAPASLVRVAGVNVGKVESVSPVANCKSTAQTPQQCSAADVTMTISSRGSRRTRTRRLPSVRGSSSKETSSSTFIPAPRRRRLAPSGYVFPIQQGTEAGAVRPGPDLAAVDTRHNLQVLLEQYGTAVKQAGPSYSRSINYWLPAYRVLLGRLPRCARHPAARSVQLRSPAGDGPGALSAHPQNLENLVTDFNTTANAFARAEREPQSAVAELPKTCPRRSRP